MTNMLLCSLVTFDVQNTSEYLLLLYVPQKKIMTYRLGTNQVGVQ